jgi:hypothetical protein
MPTYAIGGTTFASAGITDASITYKVVQADEMQLTATSYFLNLSQVVSVTRDGTTIFKGRVTNVTTQQTGSSTLYQFTLKGPLYELDNNVRFTSSGNPLTFLTTINGSNAEVVESITEPGYLALQTWSAYTITLANERLMGKTKGDVFRYIVGKYGNVHTYINYGTSTPSLKFYDLSYSSPGGVSISSGDALSVNVSGRYRAMSGFRVKYFVEFTDKYASSYNFFDRPGSIQTRPIAEVVLTDTSGTVGGHQSGGTEIYLEGWREYISFPYSNATTGTLGDIYRNTTQYTYAVDLQRIMKRYVGDYRTWTNRGTLITTSATYAVNFWWGQAPSSYNLAGFRPSYYGVPFTEAGRPNNTFAPYCADVTASIYIRPQTELIATYLEATFPAIANAGNFDIVQESFTEPVAGVASAMVRQQNGTLFEGEISARFNSAPNGNATSVTVAGSTYTGVKAAKFDLKNEIVTYQFGETPDISRNDYVRALRGFS